MARESSLPCIAVDIPSGLHGDSGKCLGPVLHCVETVTFHRPKTGLYLSDGPEYTGTVTVHPILIPRHYGTVSGLSCMESEDLSAFLPGRSPTAHKGIFGRTLIFAGSEGMAGAAAMCASAAVRAGSGLTTLLCPSSLLPILQVLVPAATCIVLPEDEADRLHTVSMPLRMQTAPSLGVGFRRMKTSAAVKTFPRCCLPCDLGCRRAEHPQPSSRAAAASCQRYSHAPPWRSCPSPEQICFRCNICSAHCPSGIAQKSRRPRSSEGSLYADDQRL